MVSFDGNSPCRRGKLAQTHCTGLLAGVPPPSPMIPAIKVRATSQGCRSVQRGIKAKSSLPPAFFRPAKNNVVGEERHPFLGRRGISVAATYQLMRSVFEADQPSTPKAGDDTARVNEVVAEAFSSHIPSAFCCATTGIGRKATKLK